MEVPGFQVSILMRSHTRSHTPSPAAVGQPSLSLGALHQGEQPACLLSGLGPASALMCRAGLSQAQELCLPNSACPTALLLTGNEHGRLPSLSTCPSATRGLHPLSSFCRTRRAAPPCSGMILRWGTSSQHDTAQIQATSAAGPASRLCFGQPAASPHTDNPTSNHCMMEASILFFNMEINLKVERKTPPNNKYYAFMK